MGVMWRGGMRKKQAPPPGQQMQHAAQMLQAFTTTMATPIPASPYPANEKPPQPALKDLGLAIEPIVASRDFGVYMDGNDPVLTSFNGCPWPAYEPLYAICGNDPMSDHDSPHPLCNCGIYAWHGAHRPGDSMGISGEVYLWGDVLICDFGYRAEIAYPRSLHICNPPTRIAQRVRDGLADMYGVPVTLAAPGEPLQRG